MPYICHWGFTQETYAGILPKLLISLDSASRQYLHHDQDKKAQ